MSEDDLNEARAVAERLRKESKKRSEKTSDIAAWWRDQRERNGFRILIEQMVRGK